VPTVSDVLISDVYSCISGTIVSDLTGTCESCDIGTYKTASGTTSCINCPSDSNAAEGSTKVSDCTCNRGYIGPDGSTCTACVVGKYKVELGDAACTNCVAGKYSTAVGATSDVCQMCPTNSDSAEGSGTSGSCSCNSLSYYSPTQISCSGECPCPSVSGLSSGEILSQTTIEYETDLNCKWIISSGYDISVQFSRFATENYYDFVYIDTCTSPLCGIANNLLTSSGLNIPPSISAVGVRHCL